MSRRALVIILVVVLVVLVVGAYFALPRSASFEPAPYVAKGKTYDVEIVRDEFGVPHIHGQRDADVAYGLGFAQAEDDFETLQDVVLAMRGELATLRGPDAGPTDYLIALFDVWGTVDRRYETDTSSAARALAEAYADGFNHYAALHPEEVAPDVVPMTGRDVIAGFVFKTPFFYGLDQVLLNLYREVEAPAPSAAAFLAPGVALPALGSNAFAVTSSRSGDGKTRLVLNSHQPYVGPVAWYEAHLVSEEGLDMYGGTFPGSPVILHGHNRHLGWASTVNRPDLVDVYRLEIDPEDPKRYRFDGAWRTFDVKTVKIRVKVFGRLYWTVEKEALTSAHGPVLQTSAGFFAIRHAGREEVRQLDQFYAMNRARSFDEWRDAMRMLALPSINFVYADREDHVAMFYNGQFPRRREGVDWAGILPGDDPSLVWDEYLAFDELPHVIDPPSGFVFSANHTPFAATDGGGNPSRDDYSPTLGIEERMTNRARRVLALVEDETLDRKTLERIKYDKRYAPESDVAKEVKALCATDLGDDPLVVDARKVFCGWDLSAEPGNTAAALVIPTIEPILKARREGRLPPDGPSLLLLNARILQRTHERIEVPWERVNRLKRGTRSVGLGGGPDTLRAVHGGGLEEDGTRTANLGDTLIVFVEWGAGRHVRTDAVHQFGSATTRPRSKHYADQMRMFADEALRRVPLDEAALSGSATRTYRP